MVIPTQINWFDYFSNFKPTPFILLIITSLLLVNNMKLAKNNTLVVLVLHLMIILLTCCGENIEYDIKNYGAAEGVDIGEALSRAWVDAMASNAPSKVIIPEGIWQLRSSSLLGPNSGPVELQNRGTVRATATGANISADIWITIQNVDAFSLTGGGVFDGVGKEAWGLNDCKTNSTCIELPTNLDFRNISNSIISDIRSVDSKFFHVKCDSSRNVTFARLTISAPGDSPNTDGIHVARSTMVNITDSVIGTGDDCISIGDGVAQLYARNVTCGPGHGISIGSLGSRAGERDVSGVHVDNCTFVGTTNGLRIKTWPSSKSSQLVSGVSFQDLIMENASNPIIIDQTYCPSDHCDPTKPSLVGIRDVVIDKVRGSTSSVKAVSLLCSEARPCSDVRIDDVDLKYVYGGINLTTACANIRPVFTGRQEPPICRSA